MMLSMQLDEKITLTAEDKQIQLPLSNLLKLAMVYLRPHIDGYLSEVAKKDIKVYNVYRPVWDDIYKHIMEKLGVRVSEGDAVLL